MQTCCLKKLSKTYLNKLYLQNRIEKNSFLLSLYMYNPNSAVVSEKKNSKDIRNKQPTEELYKLEEYVQNNRKAQT